ncbi:toxin-antitoxin system YwqK family antitoxin [Flavobacterium sp.]|jgi:antitoxin component YwqK of YwqJK toxin-antitoxin module|uniref:toxin-antitoxin system YwqK family antitoxin n=1 Tax=Flavobacterium sp. TaxID=239 RepID=UPI003783B9B5
MKYIFLFLLSGFVALGQDYNKLDENGKKHGLWKGFYEESKRLRYEGTFEHGKEIGVFKFFDDTKAATVIATREFNANDNSCYTIFFNQKNNKVSEGKVVNKQFEGEWKYYHENSPQVMTLEYYTNGKLNGVRKVFYKSGVIAEETTYKDGVKEGLYKSYAENGIVLEESNFKNGLNDGMATYRTATNDLSSQGVYKNGKKVGVWKILEKGKLKDVNMDKQRRKFQKRVKPLEEN